MNELWTDFLLAYGTGAYGFKDEVNNTGYAAFCRLLQNHKPLYYLEKELGDAFIRTQLPLDMAADDINWKHTGFRVMLPKGVLTIEREGVQRNIMYLDIARVVKDEELMMPVELRSELNSFVASTAQKMGGFPEPFSKICGQYRLNGFLVVGHLDYREVQEVSYVLYADIKPWDGVTFKDIFEIKDQLKGSQFVTRDQLDDLLLIQMEQLALNILLYMSAVPFEYEPKQVLRKKQMNGNRPMPELVPAKFVGSSQVRARFVERSGAPTPAGSVPTGRTLPPHAVAGHWRRIPYGPKHSLRKLTWIHPYLTGEPTDTVS